MAAGVDGAGRAARRRWAGASAWVGRRRRRIRRRRAGGGAGADHIAAAAAAPAPASETEGASAATGSPRVYKECELYELAFSYRNVETEMEYLIGQWREWARGAAAGGAPRAVLEAGAGPAAHAIEASRALADAAATVVAFDIEPSMAELGARRAREACAALEYRVADMSRFDLGAPVQGSVDLAFCLLGTLAHLHSADDLLGFFRSCHAALSPGGVLVVELEHPSQFVFVEEESRSASSWYVEEELRDGEDEAALARRTGRPRMRLGIRWGDEGDAVDPVRCIRRRTVSFTLFGEEAGGAGAAAGAGDGGGGARAVDRGVISQMDEVVEFRAITVPELQLLARMSGLEIVEMHGEMDAEFKVPVDFEDAYRLIVTMRRPASP